MFRSSLLRLATAARNPTTVRSIQTSAPKQGGGGGHWLYRTIPVKRPVHTFEGKLATGAGAIFWWWFLWHMFTDYHHLIGHFHPEDSANWSDRELGIPPLDAEDPL